MENRSLRSAARTTSTTNPQDPQGNFPSTDKYIKFSNKNKGKSYHSPQADKTIDATTANTICNCPTCFDSRYEKFNEVGRDSIYAPPFEELKGGKIYVSLDAISDIEKEELWKRLGPSLNKNIGDYDNE